MYKTIDFSDDRFSLNPDETRVSPMVFSKSHGFEIDDRMTKTAASEDALSYAASLKPIPGARIILVSAMGSSDAWGANKKGDTFPEEALLGRLPREGVSLFDRFRDRLPKEWGISLFPTKFDSEGRQIGGGNTFHEHINRPAKPLGVYGPAGSDCRCGDILAAFWNAAMRRVELIQTVWERKLPHIVKMIDGGFLPGISMACDVPFDRCSICNNLSRNDGEYCEHLQRGTGLRGKIWNNSKTIMMINDFPLLFDSSIVASPAAVEGRTLRKVAHFKENPLAEAKQVASVVGDNPPDSRRVKAASLVQALRSNERLFSAHQLDSFNELGLVKSACLLSNLGISFTGEEIGYMLFPKSATSQANGSVADEVYASVLHQRVPLVLEEPIRAKVASFLAKQGSMMGTIDPTDMHRVIRAAAPLVPMRSYAPSVLPARAAMLPELSVQRVVDLNQPLRGLNQETKAILLTRILADVEIVKHLQEMLVKPLILWELNKVNMGHLMEQASHSESSVLPVLHDMARDYVQLEAGRDKFYNSHPGAL